MDPDSERAYAERPSATVAPTFTPEECKLILELLNFRRYSERHVTPVMLGLERKLRPQIIVPPVPGEVVEVPHDPPFARGDVVVAREGLTDVPPQMRGKVKKVKRRPLSWHANVRWNNGGRSHMIDCDALELASSALDRVYVAASDIREAQSDSREAARRVVDELAKGHGWYGTAPAEGTRRHLIRQAIETVAIQARAQPTTALFSQLLADAVESALLNRTIEDEEEQDTGASKGNDAPTEDSFVPDEFDCSTAACERLFERLNSGPVPNCAELARTIDILRHGVKH